MRSHQNRLKKNVLGIANSNFSGIHFDCLACGRGREEKSKAFFQKTLGAKTLGAILTCNFPHNF